MTSHETNRRDFLKACAIAAGAGPTLLQSGSALPEGLRVVDSFSRPDSLYHGDGWESLNPGYWKIENGALRRRLKNVGDRARATGFPYHWETHQQKPMPVEYDPSLPYGMIWRRDWKLSGNYTIRVDLTIKALRPIPPENEKSFLQNQDGYALAGICFGGASLYESWSAWEKAREGAWFAAWRDDGKFGLYDHTSDLPKPIQDGKEVETSTPQDGQKVSIEVSVSGNDPEVATLTARLTTGDTVSEIEMPETNRKESLEGYFGTVGRGLLDFEVNQVSLVPYENEPIDFPLNDLHVCYALGDTLEETSEGWRCKMIALFRGDGDLAEVRIAASEEPSGGWREVPIAGSAPIVNNDFRLNTAVLEVMLPCNPAEKTLYYTVWKDRVDVTADPRTGFLGEKDYVGRLPKLEAPYRLCGLSCHAINGGKPELPNAGKFGENWIYDQPTPDAYKYLDDYGFQIMHWEDDVWYLELVLYPPSTDDAYKIVTTTIAGPTTRWQMMRHWNVLNPGDHDHGMDDVKGPEQIALRNHNDLGQDPDYMRRNFQIVSLLMRGDENPSAIENPKRWRRWKMPNRDFSFVILDSRLWRSSQDTNIWDDEGWGHKESLYSRRDPTRALLGEEQFAWLEQIIRTDSSPLICVAGINGLHTIWRGGDKYSNTEEEFKQRDRVAADYAGWVAAGSDRVIELLSSRNGIVSVYGDVHNGCILKNVDHQLYECSFGPIGRYGGRAVIEGFGPKMKDIDGRELEVFALYHSQYGAPDLSPREGPEYWNFLEMLFDPRGADPGFQLKIRNLIDPPTEIPRGGGSVEEVASQTGRPIGCRLPSLRTLPNADVLLLHVDGRPIRGTRSLADGSIPLMGLPEVAPGNRIRVSAFAEGKGEAFEVEALPL